METRKDSQREVKKREEALVLSGGELDTEGLNEDVQELFPRPRRRNGGGAQRNQ